MRVLLCHKFHHLTGGAEVFYFEVARVLKSKGHDVAFFTTSDSNNIDTGDKVYTVNPPSYSEKNLIKKTLNSTDIFYSRSKMQKMAEAIADFKPDIIHVFAIHVHLTPSILEAAKKANVPVVMSCNDYKHICPNYKLFDGNDICTACRGGKFYKAIQKKCCKNSIIYSVASSLEAYVHQNKEVYEKLVNKYLFASEFMLETTKEFWHNKEINYGILKNPFDFESYEPNYSGDYALYFGRIIEEKGVHHIVEAAQKTHCAIKIVGDGPDLEKLKKIAYDLNIQNIEFLGSMWGSDLKNVLYNCSFVIVPSIWHENYPYVILQAFAAGKAVIGSKRGGIPELVGNERGILFEPNDSELHTKINYLSKNKSIAENMGKKAREYMVDNFTDDVFYTQIMKNYRSVLL